MRGRKPIPTGIKLLRGNPGKRPLNADEPKLPDADAAPPKGLTGRALAVWKEYATDLVNAGVLKSSDRPVFRTYCELVAEVERYTKLCRKVGEADASRLGYPKRLDVLRKQQKEYSAVLGLNPSARSQIKATPKDKPGDATADFLFGHGKRTG